MKGASDIQAIHLGAGTPVVPVWSPGTASDTWTETEWRCFGTDEDSPYGGAWEGTSGSLELEEYPYDEVCVMLTGSVALIDTVGNRREFRAGEAFLVPRGFQGTWVTLEPSSKVFVALPPQL